jgi:hypothetical protein
MLPFIERIHQTRDNFVQASYVSAVRIGRADSPAVPVLQGEQGGLPQYLRRGHASRELPPHGLRDHEVEAVGQAIVEATAPMARFVNRNRLPTPIMCRG